MAVTELDPRLRAFVATVALPPIRGALSVEPQPKMKVTAPVGVPAPGATGLTVAVRVTSSPTVEGSGEEVTVVTVGAETTTCKVVPLEGLNWVSPL
jgi:hypothetical protein